MYDDFTLPWRTPIKFSPDSNNNPRCFIAIELENKTTRKHRLGSLINAAALGKIAIIVTANESVLKSFKKLLNYLIYLNEIKKIGWAPRNIILINADDFIEVLRNFIEIGSCIYTYFEKYKLYMVLR